MMLCRLVINSSCRNLKAVLLHNGISLLFIPIGYSVEMKETQNSIDYLLTAINDQELKGLICVSLKVVALLGSTKVHKVFLFSMSLGQPG